MYYLQITLHSSSKFPFFSYIGKHKIFAWEVVSIRNTLDVHQKLFQLIMVQHNLLCKTRFDTFYFKK